MDNHTLGTRRRLKKGLMELKNQLAYVYLDWFAQRQSLSPFDSFNIHRLLITSVLVATKFIPSWTIGLLVTKDLRRVVKELLWS
ncbi:Cyclin-U4-1 -like protein [Gossypium arboreum]|uniref:Cyclin-U4-1-like protein n=1 Tax=Gossypium arboreum TaxID=29729 RepID=A0A0B0PMD5_GOSAR|nr:Cyclin-U4-1 -like protein [Gossypium arboreum]